MSWPLMEAFHIELRGNPASKDNLSIQAALDHFLEEAKELYKVQCRVCSGYGHTKDYCTTLPRLKLAMGPNPTVNSWLNRAQDRTYTNVRPGIEKANHLLHLGYKLPKGFMTNSKTVKKSAYPDGQ